MMIKFLTRCQLHLAKRRATKASIAHTIVVSKCNRLQFTLDKAQSKVKRLKDKLDAEG
jgi:hypothetical protein